MMKNCTCLHCNYSVCKNIYSSSIQMDLAPVWWTGKHLKELEILRKMLSYLQYDETGLTSFCFCGPDLSLSKQNYAGGAAV